MIDDSRSGIKTKTTTDSAADVRLPAREKLARETDNFGTNSPTASLVSSQPTKTSSLAAAFPSSTIVRTSNSSTLTSQLPYANNHKQQQQQQQQRVNNIDIDISENKNTAESEGATNANDNNNINDADDGDDDNKKRSKFASIRNDNDDNNSNKGVLHASSLNSDTQPRQLADTNLASRLYLETQLNQAAAAAAAVDNQQQQQAAEKQIIENSAVNQQKHQQQPSSSSSLLHQQSESKISSKNSNTTVEQQLQRKPSIGIEHSTNSDDLRTEQKKNLQQHKKQSSSSSSSVAATTTVAFHGGGASRASAGVEVLQRAPAVALATRRQQRDMELLLEFDKQQQQRQRQRQRQNSGRNDLHNQLSGSQVAAATDEAANDSRQRQPKSTSTTKALAAASKAAYNYNDNDLHLSNEDSTKLGISQTPISKKLFSSQSTNNNNNNNTNMKQTNNNNNNKHRFKSHNRVGYVRAPNEATGGKRPLITETTTTTSNQAVAIECHNLKYQVTEFNLNDIFNYKQKQILHGINLTVPEGTIYGLLGPSGCGKTTMLKCVAGRLRPTSGSVRVFGFKPGESGSQIPGPAIGYMPQELSIYEEFSINETLTFFGMINRMERKQIEQRVDFLLEFLDLPHKHRAIRTLSGGQKRRVSLAAALVHSPPLLILDEPTVGVDPLLREIIWNYLVQLAKNDLITIVITTHYIEEARQANIVGLMRHGRLLAEDSPLNLMSRYQADSLEKVFLHLCMQDKKSSESANEEASVMEVVDTVENKENLLVVDYGPQNGGKSNSNKKSIFIFTGPPQTETVKHNNNNNNNNLDRQSSTIIEVTNNDNESRTHPPRALNERSITPTTTTTASTSDLSASSLNDELNYLTDRGSSHLAASLHLGASSKSSTPISADQVTLMIDDEAGTSDISLRDVKLNDIKHDNNTNNNNNINDNLRISVTDKTSSEQTKLGSNSNVNNNGSISNINGHHKFELSQINNNDNYNKLKSIDRERKYLPQKTTLFNWFEVLWAVTWKNYLRLKRNPPVIVFEFILPAFQVLLFCFCIGGDPFDVPLAVVNEESPAQASRMFLNSISKATFNQIPYDNLNDAIDSVKRGQTWGVVHIPARYTKNLQDRLFHPGDMDNTTLTNGTISIYPDLTNLHLAVTMESTFREAFIKFARDTLDLFGYDPNLAELPVKLEKPIYGAFGTKPSYLEFMAPGVIISITYVMATGLTALAFILEKRDGLLERSQVSGVTTSQILLAHVWLQVFVMMFQIALVLLVTFYIFEIPSHGSFYLVIILILLQGCTGMGFGLIISAICNEENTAVMMLVGTFYINLILAGIIWPLEAMPRWLRVFSYAQPQTLPVESLRNILSRGWTFEDPRVYSGFLVTIGWLIVFLIGAGFCMRYFKH